MKKIFNLFFIGIGLAATSCSELPEYELPYDLVDTTLGDVEISVTPENSVCPGAVATFNVDSESEVLYLVQRADAEPLTSQEVWASQNNVSVDFQDAGSESGNLQGVEFHAGTEYTVYAITVNRDGMRSEALITNTFSTSPLADVVETELASAYVGTVFYGASAIEQFEVTPTKDEDSSDEGSYVLSLPTLWGDAIAALVQNPDYNGALQYPGTLSIAKDFSVSVGTEWPFGTANTGSYDPCTGAFSYNLATSIFDDPETEVVEMVNVTVELAPVEDDEVAEE